MADQLPGTTLHHPDSPRQRRVSQEVPIIAASDSALDRALVERLRLVAARQNVEPQDTQSLNCVLLEAATWLAIAAIIWVITLACCVSA